MVALRRRLPEQRAGAAASRLDLDCALGAAGCGSCRPGQPLQERRPAPAAGCSMTGAGVEATAGRSKLILTFESALTGAPTGP